MINGEAVQIYEGEVLIFHKITRSEMGAYLCSKSQMIKTKKESN